VRIDHIRNFCIIAHIDHGKSTLADRLLESTHTLDKREMREQVLDSNELERERGITIKLHAIRMGYRGPNGTAYELNLIDTPGHVDFTYEVSRSLAACEGAVLVVDAAQGVQAQTLSNLFLAMDAGLEIIPVLNKIDLPGAEPEKRREELVDLLGCEPEEVLLVSAKEGTGVEELLERIVAVVPPPEGDPDASLRALIFDSFYDQYQGAVPSIRVVDGSIRPGMNITFGASDVEYEVDEVGFMRLGRVKQTELNPGDVQVRLTIARDISNAGDPAAALQFAQEGLEVEPDNITLTTYIGHFAANAAAKAEQAMNNPNREATGAVDPSRVTEYYQTAAESYERVFNEKGTETEPEILERLIVAKFKLQDYEQAVSLGARATEAFPENPSIWESYSRALQEAGQMQQALAALQQAEELGGEATAALTQRKGMLLLRMNRDQQAVATIIGGVDAGLYSASDAFRTIFAHAYQEEFQNGNLDAAFALLDAAGPVAESREDTLARNFWRGYILFQQGQRIHAPATAESAREALPVFERALEFFQAARGYEEIHASADVPKFIDNTQRFIEIEEALIKRGR